MILVIKKIFTFNSKIFQVKPSAKNRPQDLSSMNRSVFKSHVREVRRKNMASEEDNAWMKLKFNLLSMFEYPIGAYYYLAYILSRKRPLPRYKEIHQGIFPILGSQCSIGLLSDWASYTSESIRTGNKLKEHACDITIHMGDIYYVGSREDVLLNFGEAGAWPWGKKASFAIPGNHEYFSSAAGFYEELLPKMGLTSGEQIWKQESGFFCLENDYWRIIGLDTGYHSVGKQIIKKTLGQDARLDDYLLKWLKEVVKPFAPGDNRGIILLTHHQPKSAFESPYEKIVEQLAPILGNKRPFIWLWGHEHRLAFYGTNTQKDSMLHFGRCIGHGGMPVALGNSVKLDAPDLESGQQQSLVFHDQRSNPKHEELKTLSNQVLGYNGYATIELDHQQAILRYYDDESRDALATETWEINTDNGDMTGAIDINESALSFFQNAVPADAVTIQNH
jgi:hypothetical protein